MVWSPEKCFDETRYEYLEAGESWARVHRGHVQQCECAGGQVQCEDTPHTGTPAGRVCVSGACPRGIPSLYAPQGKGLSEGHPATST